MGQYWTIVNLTTMQTAGDLGKLGEGLWGDQRRLLELITAPKPPPSPVPASKTSKKPRCGPTKAQPGRLSFDNIPPELISLIFGQMDDFHNAFSFGLTCTFVWMCGERRIQQLYAISRAPWIGQRLICLGDYVQDFPPRLCDPPHLEEIAEALGYDAANWDYLSEDDEDDLANPGDAKPVLRRRKPPAPIPKVEAVVETPTAPGITGVVRNILRKTASSLTLDFWRATPESPPDVCISAAVQAPVTSPVKEDTVEIPLSREARREAAQAQRKKRVGRLAQWACQAWKRPQCAHTDDERLHDALREAARSIPGAREWIALYGGPSFTDIFPYYDEFAAYERSEKSDKDGDSNDDSEAPKLATAVTEWESDDKTVVLRNLSKRVYIRSDTFSVTGSGRYCGFGQALLSRICWSTDSSVAMRYEGDIHRGVWAGDRFDIVKLHALGATAQQAEKSGWKDVTQEVREELIAIWKSEFGDRWEEEAW